MTRLCAAILWVGCLLAADTPQDDAIRKERRSLGGTWVVESIVRDPRERGEDEAKGLKVVIIGEKVVIKAPGEDKPIGGLILKIDPSKEPKRSISGLTRRLSTSPARTPSRSRPCSRSTS